MKDKDTDSKKIQPANKEQLLSPFEDMDQWMDAFVPTSMAKLGRRWVRLQKENTKSRCHRPGK